MDQYDREIYTAKRKAERARTMDKLLPKRKPRDPETGALYTLIQCTHELLCIYDNMEEPPAMAGVCETTHDAAIARYTEATQPKPAQPEPSAE